MDIKNGTNSETTQFIIESEELIYEKFSGIGYELFNHMQKYRSSIAQYDLTSNKEDTFDLLLRKSRRTASTLKSKNIQGEAIIGIFSSTHSDTCIPVIASHFLGFKVIAYDCQLPAEEVSVLFLQIPPSVIFVDEEHVKKVESALKFCGVQSQLVVFGNSKKYEEFTQYYVDEKGDNFQPDKLETGEKIALIMFSSGTTGLPKGICLSHDSLLKQALSLISTQKLEKDSVFLHFAPYNWITAQIILIACIMSGASRVLCPITSAWEAIPKYKVTHICTSPFLSTVLMNQGEPNPLKNRSVKSFVTAGSKLYPDLYLQLTNSFPEALVTQCYGQTEATGWITIFQWHKEEHCHLAKNYTESVGKLFPGYRCKVVDHNTGAIFGPNQVGEFRLKIKSVKILGYYKKDSSDLFDEEGWLKTGDLGYYDENHCLYIVGRCKEMLTYRDFHINPQKLERILELHPAVEKAVVIGMDHPVDEYHVRGVVILKEGYGKISADQIRSFVDDQVEDRLRLRGGVQIVKSIPMTSTGKVKRKQLKEMISSGEL